ncbi:MAG: hypothetical protein OXD33_09330 [Rhodobacteraceae bacterium]|nr:hypothetical protein [Paracoccaceae bacterium]
MGENRGEGLWVMSTVMGERAAAPAGRLHSLTGVVVHCPPAPTGPHHRHDGMLIERLSGDPGDGPGLPFRVDPGHFETVHPEIDRGLIARRVIDRRRHGG